MTTRWSLGVLIVLPVLVLAIIGLTVLAVLLLRYGRGEYGDGFAKAGGIVSAVSAVVLVIIVLLPVPVGFWGLNNEWHQWRPVGGTVTAVSSRLLAGGNGGATQRFVVQFAGSDKQYACDDTRCSLVKTGDVLHLSCKRHWQYSGVPGYDCNYVSKGVS